MGFLKQIICSHKEKKELVLRRRVHKYCVAEDVTEVCKNCGLVLGGPYKVRGYTKSEEAMDLIQENLEEVGLFGMYVSGDLMTAAERGEFQATTSLLLDHSEKDARQFIFYYTMQRLIETKPMRVYDGPTDE